MIQPSNSPSASAYVMVNSIHLLLLEQMRHRKQRLAASLQRLERNRREFLALVQLLDQRRTTGRSRAPESCDQLPDPPVPLQR